MTDPAAAGAHAPIPAARADDAATMLLSLAADLPHPPRVRTQIPAADALGALADWALGTMASPAERVDGAEGLDAAASPQQRPKRPRLVSLCRPDGRRTLGSMVAAAQLELGDRALSPQLPDLTVAVAEARQAIDDEVDGGADLLLLVGDELDQAPALGLVSLLCGIEPAALMPYDCARQDARWMRDLAAIRDARRAAAGSTGSIAHSLASAGGAVLIGATAALLHAARRRTPVIIDGLTPAVAALAASALAPGIHGWWRLAGSLWAPAEDVLCARLALDPLCPLGAGAPVGASGALCVALVRMALAAER